MEIEPNGDIPSNARQAVGIVLNEIRFSLGDDVSLHTTNYDEYVKIIRIYDSPPESQPYISAKFYYSIPKLKTLLQQVPKGISEHELFLSEKVEELKVDHINQKINIKTLAEYAENEEVEDTMFYSRAQFDHNTKQFDPPIEQWKKTWNCGEPENPDLKYIGCDNDWDTWYHYECVGITEETADDPWLCPQCKSKQTNA